MFTDLLYAHFGPRCQIESKYTFAKHLFVNIFMLEFEHCKAVFVVLDK